MLLSALFLISCGGDDDDDTCTQEDWIGTYNLVAGTDSCDGTGPVSPEILIITAGQTDNSISVAGLEVNFTNCTAMTNSIGNAERKGTRLIATGGTCEAEYEKQ